MNINDLLLIVVMPTSTLVSGLLVTVNLNAVIHAV